MNGISFESMVSQQILSVRTQLVPISGRQQDEGLYHKPSDTPAPAPKDYSIRAVELPELGNPLQTYGLRKEGMRTARVDSGYSHLDSHLYVRDNPVASYSPSSGYSTALFGLPQPLYGIAPDPRYS